MAYTERYVTDAADGGSAGTEGDPWTLADALTNAVAGDRVNILSDSGYALGADTFTNVGTVVQQICFRGYNSSIGDLENLGYNSDGSLNTTGFPIITLSATLTWGANADKYLLLQNLVFTGAIIGILIGNTGPDMVHVVECSFTNTANNTSAIAFTADNNIRAINCDFECTGAAHGTVFDCDVTSYLVGCRFLGLDTGAVLCQIATGGVIDCLFRGTSGACIGLLFTNAIASQTVVVNCTFYQCERAISFPDSTPIQVAVLVNNHITDCAEYINNLNSGTANVAILEVNNRTRDNTTPRTGIGDGANVGEITTDTGGASTDYENAGSDDFNLIDAAPGQGTGMRALDIGAYKAADPAGGGGGLKPQPSMTGGMPG